jgi:hypothetical protein
VKGSPVTENNFIQKQTVLFHEIQNIGKEVSPAWSIIGFLTTAAVKNVNGRKDNRLHSTLHTVM